MDNGASPFNRGEQQLVGRSLSEGHGPCGLLKGGVQTKEHTIVLTAGMDLHIDGPVTFTRACIHIYMSM